MYVLSMAKLMFKSIPCHNMTNWHKLVHIATEKLSKS